MRYGNSAFTVAQNLLTQIRPSIYMKYCVICYQEYGDAHGDKQTNKQTNRQTNKQTHVHMWVALPARALRLTFLLFTEPS